MHRSRVALTARCGRPIFYFIATLLLYDLAGCGGGVSTDPGGKGTPGEAEHTLASIKVSAPQPELWKDLDEQLTLTLFDASHQTLDPATFLVTWSTSDATIASVTQEGRVSALRPGVATIRAAVGSLSSDVTIRVETFDGAVTHVSAGHSFTCALTSKGTAYCWGRNVDGQLGDGTSQQRLTPTQVVSPVSFVSIAAGGSHACGLNAAGSVYCWGSGAYGKLGVGDSLSHPTPTLVPSIVPFTSISLGEAHSCGVTTTGAAYCWGAGANTPPSNGYIDWTNSVVPVLVRGGLSFAQISAGFGFTCGVTTAGAAYCWGGGAEGQLGNEYNSSSVDPSLVHGGHTFTQVAAGQAHACAPTPNGDAYCWGFDNGSLGTGTFTEQISRPPTLVSGGIEFRAIGAGFSASCGIEVSGTLDCWGGNMYGELGSGSQHLALVPAPVVSTRGFTSVSLGYFSACGVGTDGIIYCWGDNTFGQLGTGSTVGASVPTRVVGQM